MRPACFGLTDRIRSVEGVRIPITTPLEHPYPPPEENNQHQKNAVRADVSLSNGNAVSRGTLDKNETHFSARAFSRATLGSLKKRSPISRVSRGSFDIFSQK